MKKYNLSIFIFRRDHRLMDNIGLIHALHNSNKVIPIFIFTKEQLKDNPYKSDNCIQFMMESLDDLSQTLKQKHKSRLFYFFGKPDEVIQNILKHMVINAVFVNRDYTPYSKQRDKDIGEVCINNGVDFIQFEDALLNNVGSITNGSGNVYVKFTPYYNAAKKVKVATPINNNYKNYYGQRNKIKGEYTGDIHKFYKFNDKLAVNGGRDKALLITNKIDDYKKYNIDRNYLYKHTTGLSAYIKFGNVSVRELYHLFKSKLGNNNDLVKQLYWRDFYHNIMEYYPNVLSNKERCFNPKYEKIPWITYKTATKDEKLMWKKWCDGTTGFPMVDAGMRQLNTTGFMHNRARMIVASFLTKNMFWFFSDGEKYFAQNLVDYDPSNNSGGWQWASSSGVDSQPYFRIFNPWLQSQKYDKDCVYIKQWIPELKNVENKHIHNWDEYHKEYKNIYFPPMLDAHDTAQKAIKIFKKYI